MIALRPTGATWPEVAVTTEDVRRDALLRDHVDQALRDVPEEGRFGRRKVFIYAAWDAIGVLAPGDQPELPEFKVWLLRQRRLGAYELARADLVAAMDPGLVEWSETDADGEAYHFIIDRNARESWEEEPTV